MKPAFMIKLVSSIWLLMVSSVLFGHGELDKRIKEISIKILQEPTNTDLFLTRGELYYQHEDYQLSIDDFKVCEERAFLSDRLYLNFSKSYRLIEAFDQAEVYANKILAKRPTHVLALKEKAKTTFDRGSYESAALLFKSVITHVDRTNTDNYFETINALESCGTKECLKDALDVIDLGIVDLGELLVFLEKGVSISLRLKDFSRAHDYQNRIIENAHRKERSYYQKALLFQEQGKEVEAKQMLEKAQQAFNALPERIRSNRASQRFETELLNQLSKL